MRNGDLNSRVQAAFEDILKRLPDEEQRKAFLKAAQETAKTLWMAKIYITMHGPDGTVRENLTDSQLKKLMDEAIAETPAILEQLKSAP